MSDYICINRSLLEDKRLASGEVVFLIRLIDIADKDGNLTISISEILECFGMTNRAQIVKYIAHLVEYGYVERLEVSNNAPTVYKINRKIFYK